MKKKIEVGQLHFEVLATSKNTQYIYFIYTLWEAIVGVGNLIKILDQSFRNSHACMFCERRSFPFCWNAPAISTNRDPKEHFLKYQYRFSFSHRTNIRMEYQSIKNKSFISHLRGGSYQENGFSFSVRHQEQQNTIVFRCCSANNKITQRSFFSFLELFPFTFATRTLQDHDWKVVRCCYQKEKKNRLWHFVMIFGTKKGTCHQNIFYFLSLFVSRKNNCDQSVLPCFFLSSEHSPLFFVDFLDSSS